jgi:hypothetical protein
MKKENNIDGRVKDIYHYLTLSFSLSYFTTVGANWFPPIVFFVFVTILLLFPFLKERVIRSINILIQKRCCFVQANQKRAFLF